MEHGAFFALIAALLCVSPGETEGQAAAEFFPDKAILYVGFSLVISGENLTSSDLVMIANSTSISIDSCSQTPPSAIAGGFERYLGQISNDGKRATATFTSTDVAQVCIKLFPSTTWSLVSRKAMRIVGPNVSSVSLISYPSAPDPSILYGYNMLKLSITGVGMITQRQRLAFKLQLGDCTENALSTASNILGGEARGLSWASSDSQSVLSLKW
eukprot:752322-Hanusia_phi.AAC.5